MNMEEESKDNIRKLNIFGKDIKIFKIPKIEEEPKLFNLKSVIKKTPR